MPRSSRLALLLAALAAIAARAEVGAGASAPPAPCVRDSQPRSDKKGLQVQLVDDALALGVRHAAWNVAVPSLEAADGDATVVELDRGGHVWRFDREPLEALDAVIRPLAAAGVEVALILLWPVSGDPARDTRRLDARRVSAPPNGLAAPNLADDTARQWLAAAITCLARRYAPASPGAGGVTGWIVGNEVNSHHWWHNLGPLSMAEVAVAYEGAVRVVHDAASEVHAAARVYVSLEHHWTIRYPPAAPTQAFPAREFLLAFAARARERGDFPWHVAFHPYPEDLFDCRFWEDTSAPDDDAAARVTFRNLPVLTRFLASDALRFDGRPRRVILSEQGFHRRDGPEGERDQAAAYAAAWALVQREPTIDAFILHRHVDHAHEGGLRLGLWTRADGSVCAPERRTALYELFGACGTAREAEAMAPYLEVLGLRTWDELPALLGHREAVSAPPITGR